MDMATRRGRWILDWPVHEGPWVVVWRAHAAEDADDVAAIKLPAAQAPPWVSERLRRERDWLAGLGNRGFVLLRDSGEEGGPWLCLEWLPEPAVVPVPDPNDVVRVIGTAAAALASLHEMGLVHCDLRAEHLRLAPDGTVRIIDFGSVEPSGAIPGLVGPAHYLPPERFLGEARALPAADVYALGVILFEMLGGSPADTRGARKTPLDPGESAPGNLRDLVRRATDPDPHRRLSAAAFAGALSAPSGTTDAPNRAGRYEIRGVIRQVRSGIIYRAFDPVLHREVVVRFGTGRGRPDRDARVARFDHPAIVRTLDHGESLAGPYVVTEMVDAATMSDRVAQRGKLPAMEAVRLGVHVGRALAHAHANGIVHGAVALDEMLLDMAGLPRLAGLALGPGGPPSADIRGLADAIREMCESIPRELAEILDRAAGPDPHASMDELVADLRDFLAGHAPVGPHRRWYLLAALALVLVIGAVLLAPAWSRRSLERTATERLSAVEAEIDRHIAAHDVDAADLAYRAWASDGTWRGTKAFAEGRIHQGDRFAARGLRDDAIEAYAEAWSDVEDTDVRTRALIGLGRAFRDGWRWAELEALVDRLGNNDPAVLTTDEVRGWNRTLAFARHDPPDLVAAGLESILGRLTGSEHRIPLEADHLVRVGADRALVVRGDHAVGVARVADGSLAWERGLEAASEPMLWKRVGGAPGDAVLLGRRGQTSGLYGLGASGLDPIFSWDEDSPPTAAWREDLDHDGLAEVYVGVDSYARRLISLVPDGRTWTIREPFPIGNRLNSAVKDLFAADLLGDGRRELVVAQGEWGAFDVRVLRPRSDRDPLEPPLVLAGRVKLGAVDHLVPMPRAGAGTRILALKPDSWASRLMFPPERPSGAPRGAYLLGWDGSGLDIIDAVPSPFDCQDAVGGDFDGDGTGEAALVCKDDALILYQQPDGRLGSGVIRGVSPRLAVDLDGDGRDEIVATLAGDSTGGLWVLGLGADRVPVPPVVKASSVPDGDPDLRERFSRAEDLLTMGLRDEAVASLLVVADLAGGTPMEAAALRRAAEMYATAGRCRDAEPVLLRLAGSVPGSWDALETAARCAREQRRYDAEILINRRLEADASAPARVRRDASAEVADLQASKLDPPVVLDFTSGLPAGVVPLDPIGLRIVPGTGARFATIEHEILRVPVRWDGGRLQLGADLDVSRLEWAGQVRIELVSRSTPSESYGFMISGIGGGQFIKSELRCVYAGSTAPAGWDDRAPLGSSPSGRLEFGSDVALGTWGCGGEGDLWTQRHTREARMESVLPSGGDYDLRVAVRAMVPESHPVVAGTLRTITIRGVELVDEPLAPLDRVRAEIALGAPSKALQEPVLPPDGIDRVVALDDTGDRDGVRRLITAFADDDPDVVRLVRLRRERLAAVFREARTPAAWQQLFAAAWMPVTLTDPADPTGVAAFTEDLGTIVRDPDPELAATLWLHRGNAWNRRGDVSAARDDFQLAARNAMDPTTRAAALVELAALDARSDADEALRHLDEALRTTPTPILLADALVVRADLARLHERPEWTSTVVNARRLRAQTTP